MQKLRESFRHDWPAYAVILLGVLVQAFLASRSLPFLLSNLLPDDAFYYFQIARNIVEGVGSSFDGFHPTNGYHPLWMLILLPIFALFSDGSMADVLPIRIALSLSILFNIGTALVLLALLRRVAYHPAVRALALALLFLNPFVVFELLNGLETSLMLMLLSLFVLAAVRASEYDRTHDYAIAGIVAGLMILARLDTAFYLVAFLIWIVVRYGARQGARRWLLVSACAAPFVLAFIAWNYLSFGMLLTSASNATTLVHHTLIVQDNGTSLFQSLKAVAFSLVYYGKEVLVRTGAPWLLFALIGAVAALAALRKVALPHVRLMPVLVYLFSGFLLLFLINAGVRFTGRSWYFISFNIFLILGAAWTLSRFPVRDATIRIACVLIALGTAATFFLGWYSLLRDGMANQVTAYEAAMWMNDTFLPTTRVGVFNAGVQGYFSHVQVVNIDGLVNNSAYDALRDRQLWKYVRDEQIEYISDFDLYLSYRFKSFLDVPDVFLELKEVRRFDSSGGAHGAPSLGVFRVLPAASPEGS